MSPEAPSRRFAIGQGVAAALGPAAWTLQLLLGFGLSGYACAPRHIWRATPLAGWDWLRPALVALNLAAIAACLLGGWAAWRAWRRDHASIASLQIGAIARGRTRYLAATGLLMNLGFLVAVLFSSVVLVGAPLCVD